MLNDKVAIITGASSGIGAALAELLAKEGATVVLPHVVRAKTDGGKFVKPILTTANETLY